MIVFDGDERQGRPMPLQQRLGQLSQLKDGWLDGDGRAPTAAATVTAQQIVAQLQRSPRAEHAVRAVRLFPAVDGGLAFERSDGNRHWTVEVSADGSMELFRAQAAGAGAGVDGSRAEFVDLLTPVHAAVELIDGIFDVRGTPDRCWGCSCPSACIAACRGGACRHCGIHDNDLDWDDF
jgi:hypothetical protein